MTTSRAPRAIIFDLDGTLVDTVGTRVDAWMAVFPRFGIDPDPEFLAPLMGSDGKYLARMVAEEYGVQLRPGEDAEIDLQAGAEFRVLNANPRVLPAVTETLEGLTDRGLPWAVATSSLPDDARASVRAIGLRTLPIICDGADVEHAKPAPDLLIKAAGLLEIEPADTWYVGDSKWDMVAATAAGMRAIAVLTGATSAEVLTDSGADVVYPTMAELRVEIPSA
jgi:HAD superfamily hydrolase (TIGR01509 family)